MSASQVKKHELIIGIPAFNTHHTLAELVEKILPFGHRTVICDDGSQTPLSHSLSHLEQKLTIIRHNTNQGKASALRALFQYAINTHAGALLVMDADGQHPPEQIEGFLAVHKKFPYSLILGNRLAQADKIPAIRRIGIRTADFLLTLITGKKICDSQCGMRLIPAGLLPHLLADTTQGFVAESNALIIAIRKGYTLEHVPIPALYALEQQSHYRTFRDTLQIGAHLTKHLLKLKKV